MNSNNELKTRIKSVKTIQKITKAMKLVATAKLQKNKKTLSLKNEYFEITREIVNLFLNNNKKNLFTKVFKNKIQSSKKLYILINSDLGFCGVFNNNITKLFLSKFNHGKDSVFVFGKKGKHFLQSKKIPFIKSYDSLNDDMSLDSIIIPSAEIYREFNINDYCEIGIFYNHFINSVTIEPRYLKLWPADEDNSKILLKESEIQKNLNKHDAPVSFEPDEETVAFEVFPKYLLITLYGACVMSKVSENSLRRLTMENATDNASDIINDLTYKYNRSRQAAITQEISEIISGATR